MSLKTLEELQASLERSLSWRKKEVIDLRMTASRSRNERSFLFRSGLILICAHWEGFLRDSLESYVAHVFSQSLSLSQLTPVFFAQAIYSDVKIASQADYPGSEDAHVKLAKRIQLGLQIVPTRSEWKVKTDSNPGTNVVAKLLASVGLNSQLGMDDAVWSTTKVFIDEQVVGDRNLVAHGRGLPLTKAELLERSARMLTLLERLAAQVLEAAEKQTYKLE